MILADISGYTKFMVTNQLAAVHGQQCITFLIETIIRQVDIPLHLQEIEGDAVFLYAVAGDGQLWSEVFTQIRTKLVRFFEVFIEAMVIGGEVAPIPCPCAVCKDVHQLKLKVIVHSGRAVFNTIGGFAQVSGTDVILAHRLLKNSVPSHEYLLMTETAYRDLGREMSGYFVKSQETCEGFEPVTTYVQFMGDGSGACAGRAVCAATGRPGVPRPALVLVEFLRTIPRVGPADSTSGQGGRMAETWGIPH